MGQRIKGFDGLRAIAVAMVIFSHKTALGEDIGIGAYGVHLFFVLSGFLIINIIHERRKVLELGNSNLRHELFRFYENRLYRIWPIYYLVAALVITLGAIGVWPHLWRPEIFAILTFTTNIFQGYIWSDYPAHFAPLWSVAVEEQFYLWAAPAFLMTRAAYHSKICIAVMCFAVLVAALTVPLGLQIRSIYVGPFTNFGLMALGGLAAIAVTPNARFAFWAAPALFLFCICPLIGWSIGRTTLPAGLILWGSSTLTVVTLLGIVANQTSQLTRFLSSPPFEFLGRISYGLYLYHSLIFLAEWGMPPSIFTTVSEIVLTLITASASWFWFEKPLMDYRDRRRIATGVLLTSAA